MKDVLLETYVESRKQREKVITIYKEGYSMKKWLAGILSAVMVFSMAGCGGSDSGDAKGGSGGSTELKMSYTTSETSVWRVACEELARQIEEGTDGRYTVSIYANEQLAGGAMDQGCQMILDGTVDLDLRSITNYTLYDPALFAVVMPFMFSSNDEVDEVLLNGPAGELVTEKIEALGVKVLGLAENGFRSVTNSKREIKTPSDLSGLKFRVPATACWVDTFKLFGADPTVMTFSEVFTALQQGAIDGQENPTDPIVSAKLYEVQDYLTKWNYAYDCLVMTCSQKLWDSLSEDDQAVFAAAGIAACEAEVVASREADAGNFELMANNGMTITELTDEEMAAFKAAAAPIYDTYREQIGDDVFAAFGYTFE